MIPARLIAKKRDGGALSADEWAAFLDGYHQGRVAEYQVAALLMAVTLRGMTNAETHAMTEIMIASGERWAWPAALGPIGDKHSTGGVGDKASLILAPVAAACGVLVPMVSGRGLGHTAGTLDKLESIPGFRTELSRDDIERLLGEVGYAMGGQTESFAPLDRKLYALRDVTATVESIPLISASIMSKKIAEGVEALVLDVKWGDGAFMRDHDRAEELARSMIRLGGSFGVRTEALLTSMEIPLGRTVGHALEVAESIAMLKGEPGDGRLRDVVVGLTERLLVLAGVASADGAREQVEAAIASGAALDRFRASLRAQGGDEAVVDDPDRLPGAPVRRVLAAPGEGVLSELPARAVGRALVDLGGGRRAKGEPVDHAVGFEFPYSVGERLERGEPWAIVHARTEAAADRARAELEAVVRWSDQEIPLEPVVGARLG